jgi:hypothetical protein
LPASNHQKFLQQTSDRSNAKSHQLNRLRVGQPNADKIGEQRIRLAARHFLRNVFMRVGVFAELNRNNSLSKESL